MDYPIVTKTVEVKGIELVWERREPIGPFQDYAGHIVQRPAKGTLLEYGKVFISLDTMLEVSERTVDDYLMGTALPDVDYHQQLALEQAGLAERETRGGCHGTEKLAEFLKEVGWA